MYAPVATAVASALSTGLRAVVENASGWPGLVVVFVYSFQTAVVLPFPSEVVLAGSLGKAFGSVIALYVGHSVSHSPILLRWLHRRFPALAGKTERRLLAVAYRWEYLGLALLLAVPLFPDTFLVYAFSVLKKDPVRFFVASFVGSAIRLTIFAVVVASSW